MAEEVKKNFYCPVCREVGEPIKRFVKNNIPLVYCPNLDCNIILYRPKEIAQQKKEYAIESVFLN